MSTDYSKLPLKELVSEAIKAAKKVIEAKPADIIFLATQVADMTDWSQGRPDKRSDTEIREIATGILRSRDELEAAKKEAEGGK